MEEIIDTQINILRVLYTRLARLENELNAMVNILKEIEKQLLTNKIK